MRLKIFGLEEEILLSIDCSTILVIEDINFFTKQTLLLDRMINDKYETNELVFIEHDKKINVSKDFLFISDLYHLPLDPKKIVTKAIKLVSGILNLEYEDKNEIERHLVQCVNIIQNVLLDIDFELESNDSIDVVELLKDMNIKPKTQDTFKLIDILIYFFDYIATFDIDKKIVFINLNLYFDEQDLQTILTYIQYKKINVLFLSNMRYNSHIFENQIVIDKDYYLYRPIKNN